VDAFGDGLEHLDVDGRGRAIVPVILEFVVADDALRTLEACESEGRLDRDARDNRTDVEGEDRRVHVYCVWVEDRRVLGCGKDGIWKSRGEGILVRAISSYIRRGEAPARG
jgi:hypothetical protein